MKGSSNRGNKPAAGWLGAMLVTGVISWGGLAGPAIAASQSIRIDAAPEDGYGPVGGTVTLTVSLIDGDGLPLDNHMARFYFMDGSANHPGGNGNDPDMTCSPDGSGMCQVQYTAAAQGEDLICVVVAGNPHDCDTELLGDPDFDDRVELVRHVSGYSGDPEPTPSVSPSPTPDPSTSPEPTYAPSSSPSPTPAVEPTPEVSPAASPSAEPTPPPATTPEPTASPTATPAPTATTEPTPTATLEPTPTPAAAEAPAATTEPTSGPTPSPEPTQHAAPEPTSTPEPLPSPSTEPTTPSSTTAPSDAAPSPTSLVGGRGGQAGAARPEPADDTDGIDDSDRSVAVAGSGVSTPPSGGVGPGDGAIIRPIVAPSAGGVDSLISGVAARVAATVKPAAAAAIATTFGFPLILMIAVVLFLIVQSRMDDRDPKLRLAPLTASETIVPFRDEEAL